MAFFKNQLSDRVLDTPASATVAIADVAAAMNRQGIDILDFSAGRAAESSPDYINQAASRALLTGDTHQTMAQGTVKFREACAAKLARENGITADPYQNIMATLGCKNALTLTLMAAVNPGDEVIVEDPCFVSYKATIGLCGGVTAEVPLRPENNFRWTKADLEAAVTDRTRVILFSSPQNPTGTVHTGADLDIIAGVAQKYDLLVISDEICERLTLGGRHHNSIAARPGMSTRSVTLMGFTKAFSMGGWRIGFAYAPEFLISAMVKLQQHLMTCAASFTQAGAAAALSGDYRPEVKAMWADWESRCDFVTSEINRIPKISCLPPEGGFYAWINIKETGETSGALAERLLKEQHMALVPGSAFGVSGEGYLRMTCVKSWEDIREGVRRLKEGVI